MVADLKLASVILPRSESPRAISRLTEFEWFHKIDTPGDLVTPEIDDLLLRAQSGYQEIDEVVKRLRIPLQVGILEIFFQGKVIKKTDYEISEIEGMIKDIENKIPSVIGESKKIIEDYDNTRKALEEYTSIKETLEILKKLQINLTGLGLMTYFYTNIFVIENKDYDEIVRSLEGITLYKYELESKEKSAVFVISSSEESERILKVFRGFNANPFSIPAGLPQIPHEAYTTASNKVKELSGKEKTLSKQITQSATKLRKEILALHETAKVAKDVLETLRKPGGTKNFAVIQGYIPRNMENRFTDLTKEWMNVVEDITDPELQHNSPVLFQNKKFVKTFEVVTESQGIPKKEESDPTPMIAIMWPIFYGIMFADLGHGLLLMGMGLLFKIKGQGNLSKWGMLIAISGASAAIAGVGAGEMFGFHLDHLAPFESLLEEGGPLHFMSFLVGVISVAELNFEQVVNILKVSIFLGIIHLVWAMALRIQRLARHGHMFVVVMEAIPNIAMYGGIVVIMMCAIGAGYDVMNMYSKVHQEDVPWVTMFLGDWAKVWIVTRIAAIVVIASMVIMMIGGVMHAKRHPEDGGSAANVVMEVFLGKTVEALAHTISYARIGIMLLVHAALLMTVNNAYFSMGGSESVGAWAMIVGGNLGIMLIEGLIVYIQSLRLHLYEFFTKWYDGGAQPFRGVRPELIYNQFIWKKSK